MTVARREFSARPPWFDTNTPSTPWRTAIAASSAVTMPLTHTFMLVLCRMRSTYSQVGVPLSTCLVSVVS